MRRAEPDEFAIVGELTVKAYRAQAAMAPDDPYYDLLGDAAGRATHAELYVAVDEAGTLLGTVTWCPSGSRYRELSGDEEGEFRALAVAPAARGRGVGEILVRHCVQLGDAAGFAAIVISTAEWMHAAHRLYQRLGFVEAPERDWSPRADVRLRAFVFALR